MFQGVESELRMNVCHESSETPYGKMELVNASNKLMNCLMECTSNLLFAILYKESYS